jgi:hypothetical protein
MMSGAVAKGYGDVVVVVEEDMMFDLLIGRESARVCAMRR